MKLQNLMVICVFFFPAFSSQMRADSLAYPIVDTGQEKCYDNSVEISPPSSSDAFYGQDAQYSGNQPSYTLSDDGLTVYYDNITSLTWTQSSDLDGDGDIDAGDKLTFAEAQTYSGTLNTANFGSYNDWRLPTIKELYSLILFSGADPSGYNGTDTSTLTPFIDTDTFDFGYGDTSAAAGERLIDAQFCSSTTYVSTVMGGSDAVFGLNLADGRIKGYDIIMPDGSVKEFYVMLVRGNADYGVNDFIDNGNGSISDVSTGLMWQQADSGSAMSWQAALAYAESLTLGGHDDWRLPNAKELQSIVDYTRSPDTTASAAIDPFFGVSPITAEDGLTDYPFYWSGTTHAKYNGMGDAAVYVCFGEALGWMEQPPMSGNYYLLDVHGAGAQRSDPKSGNVTDYFLGYDMYGDPVYGHGPQGDVIRIENHVRCVRDVQCGEPGYVSSLDGDLDNDCTVNMLDFAKLAQGWQSTYDISNIALISNNWLY